MVQAPALRGTLKIKNASTDRTARLLGGEIKYLDSDGQPIQLAKDRGDAAIEFYSYGGERLDPGMESTHSVDVPFTAAALDGQPLENLDVQLTFIPTPYREVSTQVPVSLTSAE